MEFSDAYDAFIEFHKRHSSTSTSRRIKDGLAHAEFQFVERVWWPAFHNFESLYPEYEVIDFNNSQRFVDFAYIRPNCRVAIEIDGLGSHWKDISADQFSDHCHRQNHLVIDGWRVLRFPFADVHQRPRVCQQSIQQLLGRLTGVSTTSLRSLNAVDRDIVRLAATSPRPIKAADIINRLSVERGTASRHLRRLSESGWLDPVSGSQRIHAYRVHPSHSDLATEV